MTRSTCFMGMSVTTTPHTCIGARRKWAGARRQRCGSDKDGWSRLVCCPEFCRLRGCRSCLSRGPAESELGDGTSAMAWNGRGMVPLCNTNHCRPGRADPECGSVVQGHENLHDKRDSSSRPSGWGLSPFSASTDRHKLFFIFREFVVVVLLRTGPREDGMHRGHHGQ